jgi:hypothetical protein
MTLPLGQLTLRERSALRSLVDWALESKGFRHGLCEKPLTVPAWALAETVTAALQSHGTAISAGSLPHSSAIVTEVIATGESGMSRLFRGALTIWSTTSMPFATWPKIV